MMAKKTGVHQYCPKLDVGQIQLHPCYCDYSCVKSVVFLLLYSIIKVRVADPSRMDGQVILSF